MTLPAGKGSDILSISAKTNRVHGRVKTLPYSKNAVRLEICKLPIFRYAESNRYAHIYVNSSRRDSLILNCKLSIVNSKQQFVAFGVILTGGKRNKREIPQPGGWGKIQPISADDAGAGVAQQQGYHHAQKDAHKARHHPEAPPAGQLSGQEHPGQG